MRQIKNAKFRCSGSFVFLLLNFETRNGCVRRILCNKHGNKHYLNICSMIHLLQDDNDNNNDDDDDDDDDARKVMAKCWRLFVDWQQKNTTKIDT